MLYITIGYLSFTSIYLIPYLLLVVLYILYLPSSSPCECQLPITTLVNVPIGSRVKGFELHMYSNHRKTGAFAPIHVSLHYAAVSVTIAQRQRSKQLRSENSNHEQELMAKERKLVSSVNDSTIMNHDTTKW